MLRRLCVPTVVLIAIAAAAPAQAIPPDPPPVPLTPDDGAAVAVDAGGIPVTFSCPVYRISSTGGFDVFGGPKDYGVSMSTSPSTGGDGRLADPVALVSGATQDAPDHCVSSLGAGGSQRPQETPGTYYWQVWRLCTGCAGSYEVGPVRRIVVRASARLAIKAPRTVYAGYPFIASVTATGVPNFAALRVERSGGGAVGEGTVAGGRAEPTVTLGAGTARIRASVVIGSDTVRSREITVRVRKANAWKTRASDDGSYAGTRSARLKVTRRGREIRSLSVSVAMLCPSPGMIGQFTTQVGTARVNRIRVAPDGSFVGAATPEAATSIRVRGTLKGRRISGGRAELSVGPCSGSATFSAKRS